MEAARRHVSQRDLRSMSAEVMQAVEHGEEFIVTRNGRPIGELIPLRRRRTVSRAEFAALFSTAPALDPVRFRADQAAVVDGDVRDPYDNA